jgi:putative endonuclease
MPARAFPFGSLFDALRHVARTRKWNPDQALGRRGEDLAHRFLQRQGFIIVARNYRLAAGDAEADLIAWEGETLVIVEVKSRRGTDYGPPERAIDRDKLRAVRRVAREYTRKANIPWAKVRFDLVTVVLPVKNDDPSAMELFRGALND